MERACKFQRYPITEQENLLQHTFGCVRFVYNYFLAERMCYDEKMVFPDGNAEPAGDDAFMVKTAQKMYHEISPETGEFIDFMIDHELMDLQNKPGKASTGYMTSLPSLKAPFVFSCFNHTIFDMQVLTHELGHAFAGYMARRSQSISDYYSESTDIAEIHSI